jgi:hypothetical protein
MVRADEVARLLRLFPGRGSVAVLDWRDSAGPSVCEVFVRAWAPEGFVCVPVPGGGPAEAARLAVERGAGVVVLTGEAPRDDATAGLPEPVLVRDVGGRLLHGSLSLDDLEPPDARTGSTTLTIEGRNEQALYHVDLPQTVCVTLTENPARNLVRVWGESRLGSLPAPKWFRLRGQGACPLTVGVRTGVLGDRWEVRAGDEPAEAVADPREGLAPVPLRRLGLVFDRTCPDREAWSDARHLMVSGPALRVGREYLGADVGPEKPPGDYNRGVREGLTRALTEHLGGERVDIHLAWFADVHEKGVASPDTVTMPLTAAGEVGIRPVSALAEALESCPYSPGLDVWDPLEEALQLAVAPLAAEPRPGSGILIVGNSPPNLPLQATSPFWRLLDFRKGHQTTARRLSKVFTDTLRAAENAGVPLVYLFLTHDRCVPEEWAAFNVFQYLQAEVQRALASYLPVVAEAADAEGIGRGVAEALRVLREPAVSGVVVRAVER